MVAVVYDGRSEVFRWLAACVTWCVVCGGVVYVVVCGVCGIYVVCCLCLV